MTPKAEPKFLCDAMLGHLGRRLRAAGYDTKIDQGRLSDSALIEIAAAEDRFFLTCDRGILGLTPQTRVLYLPCNDELKWASKLMREAEVNWVHAPMTRCLDCNTLLKNADETHRLRMPESIRKYDRPGLVCEPCDKIYWEGTHTQRMRARLADLNQPRS